VTFDDGGALGAMRSTILLMDDNPDDLRLYSRALGRAGYRPITSLIGDNSFSFPEHETPDLVLLDYRFANSLPIQSVARLVRDNFPKAMLVLLSSLPELPAEMEGLVDGFMQKLAPVTVAASVGIWLEIRKAKELKNAE
jgi:CheY-like chemotaxis protein